MKKFFILSIIGRSGAGKDTHVGILERKTGFHVIRTGELLRKRSRKSDLTAKLIRRTLERGGLIPTPIVFSLWMLALEKIKNSGKAKGIIFNGNPRKLHEAKMLDELFAMFGWQDRFRIYYVRITEAEAAKRLLKRGRRDDEAAQIRERMRFFRREVMPVLRYYRKRGVLVEIDGMRTVEEVAEEIERKVKRFLS